MKVTSVPILLVLVLSGAAALWQDLQLRAIREREQVLLREIREPAAAKASSPGPARQPATPPGPTVRGTSPSRQNVPARKFDPVACSESLAALGRSLLPDCSPEADPSRRRALQETAMQLFAEAAEAPPDELRRALSLFAASSLPAQARGAVLQDFFLILGPRDPAWCAELALKLPFGARRLQTLFQIWGRTDAPAALAWIRQAENDGRLPHSSNDPGTDSGMILQASVELGQKAASPIASPVTAGRTLATTTGQQAALREAASAPGAPLGVLARTIAEHHGFPAAAEALAGASLGPVEHDRAAAAIASAVIGQDMPQRAGWLLQQLRSSEADALDSFVRAWTRTDFNAAGAWLATLPESVPRRNAALTAFVDEIAGTDPAAAAAWAAQISDPVLRHNTQQAIERPAE